MPKTVKVTAPAKINLFLEITGKRPDGYHNLVTLFAKTGLEDKLELRATSKPGVELHLVNKSGCPLSASPDNLAIRAAQAVMTAYKIKPGVAIKLEKRIPIGAGLGGGSSDAGAVIRGMCELFALTKTPWKDRKLLALARKLGADVPVFLFNESFLIGRGIGEKLTPLKVTASLPSVTLVYPGTPSPTAEAYRRLVIPERKKSLTNLRALSKLKIMLEGGPCPVDWTNLLFNRLEESVLPYNESVRSARQMLLAAGAGAVLMSGSGSCVFILDNYYSCSVQSRIARLAVKKHWTVYYTRLMSGG